MQQIKISHLLGIILLACFGDWIGCRSVRANDLSTGQLDGNPSSSLTKFLKSQSEQAAIGIPSSAQSQIVRSDASNEGDHAVVLVHGIAVSPADLNELTKYFVNTLHWTVLAVLLPGHGTIPRDLKSIKASAWVEAVKVTVRAAHELSPHVTVVGFSLGGLSLSTALTDPNIANLVESAIMLAPAIAPQAKFFGLDLPGASVCKLKGSSIKYLPNALGVHSTPFLYAVTPVETECELARMAEDLRSWAAAGHVYPKTIRWLIVLNEIDQFVSFYQTSTFYAKTASARSEILYTRHARVTHEMVIHPGHSNPYFSRVLEGIDAFFSVDGAHPQSDENLIFISESPN